MWESKILKSQTQTYFCQRNFIFLGSFITGLRHFKPRLCDIKTSDVSANVSNASCLGSSAFQSIIKNNVLKNKAVDELKSITVAHSFCSVKKSDKFTIQSRNLQLQYEK